MRARRHSVDHPHVEVRLARLAAGRPALWVKHRLYFLENCIPKNYYKILILGGFFGKIDTFPQKNLSRNLDFFAKTSKKKKK